VEVLALLLMALAIGAVIVTHRATEAATDGQGTEALEPSTPEDERHAGLGVE
jgi:hypothetical protein